MRAGPSAPWAGRGAGAGVNVGPWLAPIDPLGLPVPGGPAGAPAAAWTFSPSLFTQLGVTNRSGPGANPQGTEYFGVLSPTFALQAETAQLTGRLSYTPRFRVSTEETTESRISHSYAAQALATVVPDVFFVDMRGTGDVRSALGTTGLVDDPTLSRQNGVQGSAYEITPYVVQRFGGQATARAGYSFRQSTQSGRSVILPGQTQPFFVSQDLTAHEAFGTLRSGPDWGRVGWEARSVNTVFDGSGIYRDAHRYLQNLELRYAVTPQVTLLADGGYEDQRFGGFPPFIIRGPTWGVGTILTPDRDSSLTLRYGQKDGRQSFSLDGSLAVGGRTTLFASYSEGFSSPALDGANQLSGVAVAPSGIAVDAATGVPISIASGNQLGAVQSNLFWLRRAVAAVRQTWPRDTLTLSLSKDERSPIAVVPGTTAFSQESTLLGLTWSRSLTPSLQGSLSGSYGLTSSPTGGDGTTYTLRASLAQSLSPTLFAVLDGFTSTGESWTGAGRATQNTVVLGLRQLF